MKRSQLRKENFVIFTKRKTKDVIEVGRIVRKHLFYAVVEPVPESVKNSITITACLESVKGTEKVRYRRIHARYYIDEELASPQRQQ